MEIQLINSNTDKKAIDKINKNDISKCQLDECKKKLSLTESITKCKCSMVYCTKHRQSTAHKCKYNYKEEATKLIEKNLVDCNVSKLNKI